MVGRRAVSVLAKLAVVVLALAAFVGCSSDDSGDDADASGSASASGTAPEELRTTPEAVATGLGEITDLASQAVDLLDTDPDGAAAAVDDIEGSWAPIEGTVLENDEDSYLAFEDSFALLGGAVDDGDAETATQAQTTIQDTADVYLADFPG